MQKRESTAMTKIRLRYSPHSGSSGNLERTNMQIFKSRNIQPRKRETKYMKIHCSGMEQNGTQLDTLLRRLLI